MMQFAKVTDIEPGLLGDASPDLKLMYCPARDIAYCYLAALDSVLADIAAPDFPLDYYQGLSLYVSSVSAEQIRNDLLEFGRAYRKFVLTALDKLSEDELELSDYGLFQKRLLSSGVIDLADKPLQLHKEARRLIVLALLGLKLGQMYYHVLPHAAVGRANTPQQLSGYLFSRAWHQAYLNRGNSVRYQLGVLWRTIKQVFTRK